MPSATLSFTLPEDSDALKTALKAPEMASMLWNLDQRLRSGLKHGWNPSETLDTLAEEIRREIGPLIWED
jgi:hypothetical protein